MTVSLDTLPCPAFLLDRGALQRNLEILCRVREQSGIRILFAQKAFATVALYDQMHDALDGVCASGLYEARLGREFFGGLVHTCAPAYRDDEINEIATLSDHVVFNSVSQFNRFYSRVKALCPRVQAGLRINPQCSVTTTALYDPCAPGSRLGVKAEEVASIDSTLLDGLHLHALCEQDSHALKKILDAFEQQMGHLIPSMKWINLGGGHALTREDYDRDHFVRLIQAFQKRYPEPEIFIEPGAAVVLNAGVLVASVLDVIPGTPDIAILDISCACHTPDVLEMPYRPRIRNEVPLNEAAHIYRLGGISCLAGDVFGDFGFATPLHVGTRILFEDMAQYTIVKTTLFNGVRHPTIAAWDPERDTVDILREFTYEDYLNRQG